MHFPVPSFRTTPVPEPPANVCIVSCADVQWNRPVFKAPPLSATSKPVDSSRMAEELRRIGLVSR